MPGSPGPEIRGWAIPHVVPRHMLPYWTLLIAVSLAISAGAPRPAWVEADVVEVMDEPDDAAFSTGRLERGARVSIRRDGPDGWATIDPPEGAFSLIEESALESLEGGRARVIDRFASVRPGREGAKMPGPPRVTLREGAIVRLLDRRPLVVRRKDGATTWLAIAPPRAEVRFVRAEALNEGPEPTEPPGKSRRDALASTREDAEPLARGPSDPVPPKLPGIGPIDATFASAGPVEDEAGLSREVADAVARIGTRHAATLRRPIDRWDLAPIEAAYETLLRGISNASERRAVEARLRRVRRQKAAALAATRMDTLLTRSRARDGQVAEIRRDESDADREVRAFDAAGLLQTTSRMADGRRVHAVLGDDGKVVAYLKMPTGLAVDDLLSKRVGVRGEGRYSESLRARLILVRDIEPLDRTP